MWAQGYREFNTWEYKYLQLEQSPCVQSCEICVSLVCRGSFLVEGMIQRVACHGRTVSERLVRRATCSASLTPSAGGWDGTQ
jgi:hypothetical protein